MTINFPGSLDNFTNPTSASPINSPSHADQHANANDAIEALEAKVGSNNSTITTSHDYKIAQLESLVTSSVAGAKSIYQDVRNQSGSAFTKATAVYVSGSEGASGKMLISAASNDAESTSSKTMGLTTSAISNNSNGQVISEGILEGIDTTGAADGDPVWLGTNGAKIYGLINKPSAPAHLVFLGIVIRGGQANTGSMYVKIQNGFEIQELHNVEISSLTNGHILAYNSTAGTWKNTNTLQATTTTVPLVVKAVSGQTSNLQEWQNSSGASLTYINQYGTIATYAGIYSSVSVGIGTSVGAYSAMISLNTTNASTVGMVIRGVTSQTANLQEWQNSSGTVLARVNAYGDFFLTGGRLMRGPNDYGANVNITNEGDVRGIIIRANASQTADLQQWQNSSGTVLASINSLGGIYNTADNVLGAIYNGYLSVGNGYAYTSGTTAAIISSGTSVIGLIVKGKPSQTANLQEWQNSAGTTLANISSAGKLIVKNDSEPSTSLISTSQAVNGGASVTTSSTSNDYALTLNATGGGVSSNVGIAFSVFGGTGFNGVYPPGGAIWFTRNGGYSVGYLSFLTRSGTGATDPLSERMRIGESGTVTVNGFTASSVGLIVKGATSQTADLQQWQNSNGNTVATIDPAGNASINLRLTTFNGVSAYNASSFGNPSDLSPYAYSNIVGISTNGATSVGLVIRGVTSQTADLQQWRDGTGTILTTVDANGRLYLQAKTGNTNDLLYIRRADNSVALYVDKDATLRGNFSTRINQEPSIDSQFHIHSGTASRTAFSLAGTGNTNPTFHIKASASQTSDLTQWVNSSGIVLTKIDSSGALTITNTSGAAPLISVNGAGGGSFGVSAYGGIYTNGGLTSNGGASSFGGYGGASNVVMYISGASGQTGNLTQWQTFGGTVLAKVDSNGYIYGGNLNYTYTLPEITNAFVSWVNLGTWTTVQDGSSLTIKVSGKAGYNAQSTQLWNSELYFNTSNDSSYQSALDSNAFYGAGVAYRNFDLGPNTSGSADPKFRIVQNSKTSYTVYIKMYQWAGRSKYDISLSSGTSWSDSSVRYGDTAPGGTVIEISPTLSLSSNGGTGITIDSASKVGLFIKANASQTANLQEWQNSSGSAVALVNSSGNIATGGSMRATAGGLFGTISDFSAALSVAATVSTQIGAVIRASASQTADLQQWQDSSGNVLTKIRSNGQLNVGGAVSGTTLGILNIDPAWTGLIVKGAVSQAGDLQQWQRNDGTSDLRITNFGALISGGGTTIASNPTINAYGAAMKIASGINTYPMLILQGAASQSANIQEWRNSAGTVMGRINSNYILEVYNGIYTYQLGSSQDGTLVAQMGSNGDIAFAGTVSTAKIKGSASSTISANTATTIDTVALSSFTTMEYTLSIKQGSKIRSSKVLVHTDGTSVDSTEYGIIEMGGGISGVAISASVSGTDAILQVTITDAATTNATVKLIKTML